MSESLRERPEFDTIKMIVLEVVILLYLKAGKRHDIHDVDNRLKDILDALQGRFRGPSGKKRRLIANDNKICRAVIEKRPTPKILKNKVKNTGEDTYSPL